MVNGMGKPFVRGGTPVGSESLCRTCTNAQIMTGYRESERMTLCDNPHPAMVVPFTIYECSAYYDKNRPSWDDMQKFALHIRTAKPRGFNAGAGFAQAVTTLEPGDDDEDGEDE